MGTGTHNTLSLSTGVTGNGARGIVPFSLLTILLINLVSLLLLGLIILA